MLKRASGLLYLAVHLILAASSGHGTTETFLQGTVLCADANSVQLNFEDVAAEKQQALDASLRETLALRLTEVLTRLQVELAAPASCEGQEGYVLLEVHLRYLDPHHYSGFGSEPYSYTINLSVGSHQALASLNHLEPAELLFFAFIAELHTGEEDNESLATVLESWGEELSTDLAVAWWHDNPMQQNLEPVAQRAGATFMLLLLAAALAAGRLRTRLSRTIR